ncbi:reprolysin-like metallopeptidase [Aquibium oceanicum]
MSICCILLFADRSRAQENRLFSYAAGEMAPALTADQESRAAAISSDATQTDLKYVDAESAVLRGDIVAVPLAEGTLVLGLTHRIERAADDFTWIGQGDGEGGQTVLVVRDGQITGVIYDGFVQYSLTPLGGRLHALTKIDHKAFPPDHPPGRLPVSPRDSSNRAGDPSGTAAAVQIDILGAYTPEALAANANIKNTIQLGVDLANAAYIASNAEVSLRLVGTVQVAGYSETGKTYNDLLYDLTDGTGGMAAVHAQRETLGADLVALLVNHTEYCGIAWVNSSAAYAFSVTTHTCVKSHTLSHELGHNFGALHDVANSGSNPPYNYGYGYIHPQNLFRTIQSYGAPCGYCTRIGNFSNPDVTYNGHVTGTVTTHNVARVHRERKSTVAAFRADKTPAKAVMTSPAPGSTLGSSATFQWTTGTGVTHYWLYVGSTGVGSYNVYQGSQGTNTSRTVSTLPSSGTIYVRLHSLIGGAWQFNDYTYKASGFAKAVMTSPTPGSVLGSAVTFEWTKGTGVTQYWLNVGSTGAGSYNVYQGSQGTNTSRAVSALPATGTIYVRLYSLIGGAWQFNDYTYTAGVAAKAVMTSPAPGSTLSASATFQWTTGSGVLQYWLNVGSTGAGSYNIYQASQGTSKSKTVTALPSSGTIYVRLWSRFSTGWQYNDYTYKAASAVKAVMTSPTPGSTLGSSATFTWTAGSGVTQYYLYVGSTGPGSSDIYDDSPGTDRSTTVSGLPSTGTIYVRLWSLFSSGYRWNDYTYKAGGTAKAVMTSPTPGSTLGSSATFVWSAGSGVSQYWLYVGSTGAGSANIYQASQGTSKSRTVSGLPSTGTIYVRLWSLFSGTGWQYNDYAYKAGGTSKAVMTSPTPGSTLGASATFVWSPGINVTQYYLYVGSTGAGSYNIYQASQGTSKTRTVTGLPSTGTIYVRLWSLISGAWQFNDYTYKAGGAAKAVMTSPTPGSTLGSSATFVWTAGTGVSQYYLYVGSTSAGSYNIYQASQGTSKTRTVTGLPSTGTIYVRLWSLISGAWQYNDYTYKAGGTAKAVMTSPTPGSTLGSSATFQWTTGSGVTSYYLYVGSTGAGSYNIYNANQGTGTSRTVAKLPTSGTIYVRLWSLIGGSYQYNDYTYQAGTGASATIGLVGELTPQSVFD